MYTEHFGLREAPFRATPDPRFFYRNPRYREAYATLLYGVLKRKGFIALTGEVGTGKTTLLRRLMEQLGPSVRFVFFYNTTLTFDETIEFICGELGLAVDGLSRVQRLQRLNDLLMAEARRGGTVVLLIDEAQNLGPDVLENLRLISNLETSTEKLLQIVLVGQPELDAKLADPALRQLAQRIAVRYRLEPLSDDEVEAFIDHRLRQCGRTRQALFSANAIRRVSAYSNGVPRLVNILCDGALLAAYGAGMSRVTGGMIDAVAACLRLPQHRRAHGRAQVTTPDRGLHRRGARVSTGRPLRWVAVGVAALAVAAAAAALLSGPRLTTAFGVVPPSRLTGAGVPPNQPAAALPALPPGSAEETARGDSDAEVSQHALEGVAMSDVSVVHAPGASPSTELSPRRPAPSSEARGDGWVTVVPAGTSVSEIVSRWYGRHQLLGLDLVKDVNPHIANLDDVSAGERLWVPAPTLATLAPRQPDGSYQLIVASLLTPAAANRLAGLLRLNGYTARVATRDLTRTLRVHRVVVEDLDGLETAGEAWTIARKLGWTPAVDTSAR